ncbi:Charged multivesicular body protein 7, partial [Podochytrium sp. JEL0797]
MQQFLSSSVPNWTNDDRMRALFSQFPARTVNEHSYNSRLRFWSEAILLAAREGHLAAPHLLLITPSSLPAQFQRNGLTPLGFPTVLSEMQTAGSVSPILEYTDPRNLNPSNDWSVQGLVGDAVRWGWSFVFTPASNTTAVATKLTDDPVVLIPIVEDLATTLCNHVQAHACYSTDYLHSPRAVVAAAVPHKRMTDLDLRVVACCLVRSRRAVVEFDGDRQPKMIKFLVGNPGSENSKRAISETDRGLFEMMATMESIRAQVKELDVKTEELSCFFVVVQNL